MFFNISLRHFFLKRGQLLHKCTDIGVKDTAVHKKKLLLPVVLVAVVFNLAAQSKTYQIKADSVRIFSNCDTSELILQNRTRGILNGVLTNKGNGVTEFRRILTKINENTYLVGGDSLHIGAGSNPGSMAWLLNGNSNGQVKTFGTGDNQDLPVVTNGTERMRFTANGQIGIGTSTPIAKLQVTSRGSVFIHSNLSRPGDGISIGQSLNTDDGQNAIIGASSNFGHNYRNIMVERDGNIGLGSSNNPYQNWSVGNPALRINADGRVAIASNIFNFGSFGGPYNCSSLVTYVSNVNEWIEGTGQTKGANYYYFGTSLLTPEPGNVRAPLKISGRQLHFLTGDQQGYDNMYNQGAEALRIDETGRVGIATSLPSEKLDVNGVVKATGLKLFNGYSGLAASCQVTHLYNGCGSLGYISFGFSSISGKESGSADPLTIQQSNNAVGVRNSAPSEALDVNGNIKATGFILPAGAAAGYVLTSSANGVASWQSPGTLSDFNLKENIRLSSFNPAKLLSLPVKDFNYKSDKNKIRYTGLIAQELKAVLPELVLGSEGSYSIDYVKMVPYLLKAIQDQQKEIVQLKQQAATADNTVTNEVLATVKQLQQQLLLQAEEMNRLKEHVKAFGPGKQ